MRIIVTDLTRFQNQAIRCIAGIEPTTGRCIRPRPYLTSTECREANILPGTILDGNFIASKKAIKPHIEDHLYTDLICDGQSTSQEFEKVLLSDVAPSLEAGFEVTLNDCQKVIETSQNPIRSLTTISISPGEINVVQDRSDPTKLKVDLTDASGKTFWYLPITDLGFHNYATSNNTEQGRRKINTFFKSQTRILLRIGLGQIYVANDGRAGYWIQVNGIYTFPDYIKEIRCYD